MAYCKPRNGRRKRIMLHDTKIHHCDLQVSSIFDFHQAHPMASLNLAGSTSMGFTTRVIVSDLHSHCVDVL